MIADYENALKMRHLMNRCIREIGEFGGEEVKNLRKEINDTIYILKNIKCAETEKTKAFAMMCGIVIQDCQEVIKIIDVETAKIDEQMGVRHIPIYFQLLED